MNIMDEEKKEIIEQESAVEAEQTVVQKSKVKLKTIAIPLFIIIVVSFAVWVSMQGGYGSKEVPDTVRAFLDAYLLADRDDPNLDVTTIMQTYIRTSDSVILSPEEIASQEGPGFDQEQFDSVFLYFTEKIGGYAISTHSKGYVEIILSGVDGIGMPPRVGFWFKLSADQKYIKAYTIGRLQPFSTYDSEYREVWG